MRAVKRTSDFKRIEALPRRQWTREAAEEAAEVLTTHLKTPEGTMKIWPEQAVGLCEIHDNKGMMGIIGVGRGKALLSLLAPVVCEAVRPVLFVPAALREQTNRVVIPEMRKHWKLHPNLDVRGYSELSMLANKNLLEEKQYDFIFADEAHKLKRLKSARTKRMGRYLKDNPRVAFTGVSGTISNKSIMDYWHLLYWCLDDGRMPLPTGYHDIKDWSGALDTGVAHYDVCAPGALERFCEGDESPREGYRRRLVQTPGVYSVDSKGDCNSTIVINSYPPVEVPEVQEAMLRKARVDWEDPNGDPIMEAVELWRLMRQLSLGFWYEWDPKPPKEWMRARKEWGKHVRHRLQHNQKGIDTELQVFNECKAGEPPPRVWQDWISVRDVFKINTVLRWVSDAALRSFTQWMRDHDKGIVWTEHVAFAEKLAQFSGVKYFGAGKAASREVLTHEGPMICSINAQGTGKNLQKHTHNLVTSPPPSGQIWEQLLGRTHRHGQLADEVHFDVVMWTDEQAAAFAKAKVDAIYLEESLGGLQKLNYADVTFPVDL